MDLVQLVSTLAGTFLGVALGAFFTCRLGLLIYRKQQKTTNNTIRKEQIYEPMFEDLKYIRDYLTERMDSSREYSYSQEPPLSFYTWHQIKSDRRILLVNNKSIEDNCNKVQDRINNYHLFIKNINNDLVNKIKNFLEENYGCELSRAFDASLFTLSIIDRRYPLQRAFDDLFSPGRFPLDNQWEKLQKALDETGLEDTQNQLLEYTGYHKLLDEHNTCTQEVLSAVDSARNLLIKEIRKIIKESEG